MVRAPKPVAAANPCAPPGVTEHGATVTPGAEIRGRGVRSGRGEDSAQGDPSPTDRHQPGTQEQVMAIGSLDLPGTADIPVPFPRKQHRWTSRNRNDVVLRVSHAARGSGPNGTIGLPWLGAESAVFQLSRR